MTTVAKERRGSSAVSVKLVNNKYRLGEAIGKGAFGKVCRSVNVNTGEVVAIKQIEKHMLDQDHWPIVQREQEMLQKLIHPNIVKLIEQHETKSHIYIVLELVEGGSLHDLVKRCGPFPESLLRVYTKQVVAGLSFLHSHYIVHRDLKGANILLTKDGNCKLADFGSCTVAQVNRRLTMLGTPFWTAPEIIEGIDGGVTSDIWALGCTLIELLTSNPPYWSQGSGVALFKMVEDPHPPLPPSITNELTEVLLQCFVKDVDKRPKADEVLQLAWFKMVAPELSSSSDSTTAPAAEAQERPPSPQMKRNSSTRKSLFHTLFSKTESKEDATTEPKTLDRSKSQPLKKVSSGSFIKTEREREREESEGEAENPGFQVIVNSWKDKDKAAAAAAATTPRSRHSFMFTKDKGEEGQERRSRGSTISFKDPRQERRETIEASVSDWAGGSIKSEKKLKKEKKDRKREEEKKLVKDMGKKLEQEIAKRQKLTQLLEGHKNTVSLLMEQKNLLEEKEFALQKLIREKNLRKLFFDILSEEMSDVEFNEIIDAQKTMAGESPASNWRLPGSRCLVRAEYDMWQEAVILGSTPAPPDATAPPDTPYYRIIIVGRLPVIEEIISGLDLKPLEHT